MKKNIFLLFALSLILNVSFAQNRIKIDSLQEVVISSSRIDLPFKENSRTIQLITAEDLKKSGVTNVADALQQIAGIDIRRRGTSGMQADLYIRGGSFDQTLLLIDGIKVDDAQTGHHTMNLALPIEVIKRIEIIKGPAARVFGQNAFTGAVNIVTKDSLDNSVSLDLKAGSYGQVSAAVTAGVNLEDSSHIIHFSKNASNGYRYNTDFDNTNFVLKSTFDKKELPIEMLVSLSERNFGANGFYATPAAINQYEKTKASLVGFSTTIKKGNFTWKPKVYWRRNEDEYSYVRSNPSLYRNVHISNKFAAELNGTYTSNIGVTGFGIETAKVLLSSNNLGASNRFVSTLFLEHRLNLLKNKLDITPGVAVTYFSDFKFFAFPGIDIGYQLLNNVRIYGNAGYTYRVPTYTDMYYKSATTIGNSNLEPEKAFAQELGLKWNVSNFDLSAAAFNRNSNHLIDYVKDLSTDPWQAQNIQDITTKGFETQLLYKFTVNSFNQKLQIGYSFIEDDVKHSNYNFSQYALNSMKHQFVGSYTMQFLKNFSNTISYRYAERTTGNSYSVVDLGASYHLKAFEISLFANNIFNTAYTETNLIPMPKGNLLFGIHYNFR
ncbi:MULTISPECIES: TonB-dependent receptor plug domain-containing protein [unclassified Flavobacterium]|jgi:iron complex outermembrane receptor protein|uniref:TonB-dependent receptor plug domain-containing protein n=1 Tax=unclassified Flavobacterium TaxID=196869 RepID=UPI0025BCAC9E|nr:MULTISPECIES: TonB-dependent receptor [unclassified Flavobacterium]